MSAVAFVVFVGALAALFAALTRGFDVFAEDFVAFFVVLFALLEGLVTPAPRDFLVVFAAAFFVVFFAVLSDAFFVTFFFAAFAVLGAFFVLNFEVFFVVELLVAFLLPLDFVFFTDFFFADFPAAVLVVDPRFAEVVERFLPPDLVFKEASQF